VLDEVEKCRLGPMDVLDHQYERPLARASFDRLANRPEDLLRRSRAERRVNLVLGAGSSKDLTERPVGDALAVGQAAAEKHDCLAT
jgi:hypothetical protein